MVSAASSRCIPGMMPVFIGRSYYFFPTSISTGLAREISGADSSQITLIPVRWESCVLPLPIEGEAGREERRQDALFWPGLGPSRYLYAKGK